MNLRRRNSKILSECRESAGECDGDMNTASIERLYRSSYSSHWSTEITPVGRKEKAQYDRVKKRRVKQISWLARIAVVISARVIVCKLLEISSRSRRSPPILAMSIVSAGLDTGEESKSCPGSPTQE